MPPVDPTSPTPTPTPTPPVTPQPNVAPPVIPRLPSQANRSAVTTNMLEPGEELVTVIHRHFIGIVGYFIEALIGLLVLIGFGVFIVKTLAGGRVSPGVLLVLILLAVTIIVFFLFVTVYVYRQCRLIITSRSLIQVFQKSLFSRKVSRLSLSNVEDVSANSQGILATIFGYGTLLVQTAGEMDNFEFTLCPNPTLHADQIIEARQRYAVALEENQEHPPFFQPVS